MSEIIEHVAELRRMASRFRGLIAYPGKYAFKHFMLLRGQGDELLDKVWDAGHLRSIQGAENFAKLNETYVEEIGCYLDAFLFSNIVGFGLEYFTIKGCRFISPGLLNQAPVTIGFNEEKKLADLRQLFSYENMIAMSKQLSEAVELMRIDGENHFSESMLSKVVEDPSTWAEAMDLFGFELFERNARGCELLIDIIENELKSGRPAIADNSDAIPKLTLKAIVDGGDSAMINQAIKIPAKQRYDATMKKMLGEDRCYYEWSLENWAGFLGGSKRTIADTDAWRGIMKHREQNKQDRAGE